METTAKYRLMGAFTLAAVLGVFVFVYWLNHAGGLGQRSAYQVRFLGAVPGLRPGAAVQFNGIRVGEVTDLRLDDKTPQQVMATISVDAATPIRRDTQVSLDFQGLMGVTSVALRGGAPDGAKLTGSPPLLVAEASAGSDLTSTARETLQRLGGVLADNSESLRSTINNLSTFTGSLAKNSDRIDGIVAGLERMTGADAIKNPTMSFDLAAPRTFPPLDKTPGAPLAVAEPTALIVLDTQKLIVRSPAGARTQMTGNAQWADALPKLVQAKVMQAFENATSPAMIARTGDNLATDRQLLLDIRSFDLIAGSKPEALVELAAKVVADGNRVVDARTFSATAPAEATDGPAAAAALNQAFGHVATELVVWVQGVNP
ncbi:MAG: ABC-type transport auxiliary lipoprotein family protein [Xanthobacteraceae bacterium]|nr:ABC-type transport auxiliary lipoprotein family protein [Xanthobacteraceae bacterium]